MTGDIAQNAEKNNKKNLRVRIDKGYVTSNTEDDVTLSSTSTSSAHQQQILASKRARNKNQSNNDQSEKLPPKDPGE
eukprot:10625748-Ditylum_brightwellii.AAC.1